MTKTAISRCERCGLELHGDQPATGDCPRCGGPDRVTTWVTRWVDPPAARYAVDTSTDPPTVRVGAGDLTDFHDVLDRLEATGKTSVQIVAATDQALDRARRVDRRLYELGYDVLPMDLRPGSPQMLEFVRYVSQRRREGRTMAESRRDDPEAYDARMRDLIPGYYPPQYPMIDAQHGIEWTEEDEEIMDRIHAEHPRTEEDRQRELEFLSRIRPGTRAPLPEAARRRLDAAKRGEHGSRSEAEETDQGPAAD
jgi:hypothetical protein